MADPTQDTFATSKVADGPLFITDADNVTTGANRSFTYYVVARTETCGPTPGAPDEASGTGASGTTFPGRGIAIAGDALRTAKAFILADEKLCVRQHATFIASLPAVTLSWSGYRPYSDG
jgi:hypothetical protein